MLVEEAGQVLEAHVLGSLVPTVQHMILIGDPLQLRPTIENFCTLNRPSLWHMTFMFPIALSMDHHLGGELYRFDMSLMERLSSSGFSMSQINVQRRMRPQVSNLVRYVVQTNSPALAVNARLRSTEPTYIRTLKTMNS